MRCSKPWRSHISDAIFFNNGEMVATLEKGMWGSNDDENALLKEDLSKLHEIRNSNDGYRNTRYHCSGVPFRKTYNELDWTTRL